MRPIAVSRTVLIAVAALAAGACGRKGPLVAPELVHPSPPAALAAASTPAGVRLNWHRPDTYTSGRRMNDLASFDIQRAVGEGGGEFIPVGTLELDDRTRFRKERRLEWVDQAVEAGTVYRYRVIALTLDGYRSRPAGPVSIRFEKVAAEPKKEQPKSQ